MADNPPFSGPFAPSDADLSRCVHCGLCLESCPTYTETGLETESPRGRLYLIKAIAEERIEATPTVVGHLDLCLQCRNCEAVCPSGVPYGRIMEGARAELLANRPSLAWRLRGLFLREVIARPRRMAAFATLLRLYRASGLRWLAERAPFLRDRVILAPTISGPTFRARGVLARPDGTARGRVALLIGCIMPLAYGRIMEGARAEILANRPNPAWRLRALFLREVIARPNRMAAFATLLRLYRASGLRWLAERAPLLRERVILAPTISGPTFRARGVLARPRGEARGCVALLIGCIMPHAYGRVHEATVRVLDRNGFEVVAPPGQACCGALHAHNGDRPTARALARRNIDAFLDAKVDAVVVNSAGCGSAMKEYGELLADDPEYAEKAERLAATVKDITELLAELPLETPAGRIEAEVTYQDSCHLAHAQRISSAPRELLAAIPGLRLVEMAQPDRCCGSAGIYSLAHRDMSLDLLDGKMREIAATGAGIIATANPGCMAQLEAGLRRHRLVGRVVHVVELLDEAYR